MKTGGIFAIALCVLLSVLAGTGGSSRVLYVIIVG